MNVRLTLTSVGAYVALIEVTHLDQGSKKYIRKHYASQPTEDNSERRVCTVT